MSEGLGGFVILGAAECSTISQTRALARVSMRFTWLVLFHEPLSQLPRVKLSLYCHIFHQSSEMAYALGFEGFEHRTYSQS